MIERRRWALGIALFVAVGTVGLLARAQTVFPVRLDPPAGEAPATAQGASALNVNTGLQFSTRAALTVSAGSPEDLLTVTASEDDTTVLVRVQATSRASDSSANGSLREELGWAIFDTTTNSWANIQEALVLSFGTSQISIDFTGSGTALTAKFTTPATHDLATVTLEAMANKAVTYATHF